MFTADDRRRLLDELVERSRADPAIDAAALVGSAARRALDDWSDVDLALGLAEGFEVVKPPNAGPR